MKEQIKKWFDWGLWNAEMVQSAVEKGVISQSEAEKILNSKQV